MGSFNVTCCVTKTPIVPGEDTVLVIFDDVEEYDFTVSEIIVMIIDSHITGIFRGEYDDYGRLNTPHPKVEVARDSESKQVSFFISKIAWEFGKTLTKSKDYKRMMEYLDERIECASSHRKEFWDKFGEDIKVIHCLRGFCQTNNFNMFDPSFENWYGNQDWAIKEHLQFQKLRGQKIKYLKQLIKDNE